ncbi:DUF433 domain-containing protein [Pseudanabaena sp. UWO310]|uniref:DUF433 domain-containing protein n=1 Tax=Pseudanabaena sp. UWO310 TaxID=2480795 RepID=UPI00115A7C02|nr:DUF433 domain-containing protein [Pseudanabaena sp. UWO310]TYQ30161.1 DUF433 domain-containing protein [Pseudanabaena sp. UWO310]
MNTSLHDSITIDTEIQHGKPVLKGTRIPIAIIIGSLAGGMSYEEVMQEYAVTQQQILTSLAYFAELLNYETIYPMEKAS